jgi:hypothetical protein
LNNQSLNTLKISIISAENRSLKGGEFLIKSMNTSEGFFPEDFTEEHNMIIETVRDFISKEIIPNIAKMEKQEE